MDFIKAHRAWLGFAAKAACSIALVAWLLGDMDWAATSARLSNLSPAGALAGFAFLAAQVPLVTWRWAIVSRALGRPLRFGDLLGAFSIGLFFNQTLPSTVGGDGMRIWRAYRLGQPLHGIAVNAVLIDRGIALLANLLMIAASLPWFFARVSDGTAGQALALVSVGGLAAAVLGLGFGRVPAFLLRWRPFRALGALITDARRTLGRADRAALLLGIGVAVHLCSALSILAFVRDFDLPVSPVDCILLIPPVVLISVLPVSVAGWGLRETAMVSAFAFIGLPAADAFLLSVAYGLANLVLGLPGGLVWLLTGRPGPDAAGDMRSAA